MIGSVLGGVGSMVGGLAAMAGDKGEPSGYREAVNLWEKIRNPNYDVATLTPRELKLVGEYMPEVYQFIAPDSAAQIQTGPEGRQSQLDAMGYFDQIRQEGLPLAEKMAAENATNQMSQQAQRDATYSQEAMQRRGMGQGGSAIQAQIGAGQAQSDLARQMGQDLSQSAINTRMNAAGQGAQIGGQMRGQDINEAGQNAQMWNRFNEFISSGMTQAASDAANARNQAQAFNLGEKTRYSDTNINNQNAYDLRNQEYGNQMATQDVTNQRLKAGGQANAALAQATYQGDAQAAQMANIQGLGTAFGQGVGGGADALLAALSKDKNMNPNATNQLNYMIRNSG